MVFPITTFAETEKSQSMVGGNKNSTVTFYEQVSCFNNSLGSRWFFSEESHDLQRFSSDQLGEAQTVFSPRYSQSEWEGRDCHRS